MGVFRANSLLLWVLRANYKWCWLWCGGTTGGCGGATAESWCLDALQVWWLPIVCYCGRSCLLSALAATQAVFRPLLHPHLAQSI